MIWAGSGRGTGAVRERHGCGRGRNTVWAGGHFYTTTGKTPSRNVTESVTTDLLLFQLVTRLFSWRVFFWFRMSFVCVVSFCLNFNFKMLYPLFNSELFLYDSICNEGLDCKEFFSNCIFVMSSTADLELGLRIYQQNGRLLGIVWYHHDCQTDLITVYFYWYILIKFSKVYVVQ